MNKNKILRVQCKKVEFNDKKGSVVFKKLYKELDLSEIEKVEVYPIIEYKNDILINYKNDVDEKKRIYFVKCRIMVITNHTYKVTPKVFTKLLKHLEPYIAEVIEITDDEEVTK